MSARRYLDVKGLKIKHIGDYLLQLTLPDGTQYENVEPRRMFPIMNKDKYVALVHDNGKEMEEIGIIKDIEMLEHSSYLAISAALESYYIIPKIYEIVGNNKKGVEDRWEIVTSHGRFSIFIKNRQNDIKLLPHHRILIRDANDNRYEIPDYTKLSYKSQSYLAGEL